MAADPGRPGAAFHTHAALAAGTARAHRQPPRRRAGGGQLDGHGAEPGGPAGTGHRPDHGRDAPAGAGKPQRRRTDGRNAGKHSTRSPSPHNTCSTRLSCTNSLNHANSRSNSDSRTHCATGIRRGAEPSCPSTHACSANTPGCPKGTFTTRTSRPSSRCNGIATISAATQRTVGDG